eukprot:TRINITY_DN2811_c0_g1_i1.p1 TRINITY_DN2811_c0_g1~~TRINITY_DN2811_c0_g1_i1.p1  ORF type:complete len:286 (+),score=78.51 TRINITY_DN2811_c0_g1_i1:147-1004(+)
MQYDEHIWRIINHGHCSFRVKTVTQNFCKNEYNATGLCGRRACPLANSRYATIKEQNGKLFLLTKVIERSHTPSKLWAYKKLSPKYADALQQITDALEFWPRWMIRKVKQRHTKLTEYLIRRKRLRKKYKPEIVTESRKVAKRLARREEKALIAANIEKQIEKEVVDRLKQGTYGDIYNFPKQAFDSVIEEQEIEEEHPDELYDPEAAAAARPEGFGSDDEESGSDVGSEEDSDEGISAEDSDEEGAEGDEFQFPSDLDDLEDDRSEETRLNSSHIPLSRMPSSA